MPTAEAQFLDLPGRGVRVCYRDWGGEGQTLLLLHGLSSNSRIWDLTAPLMTTRFRVVALDLRGHGLSDVPEGGYGFDDVTADVIEFLELMSLERVSIAGHSWGANVALHVAVGHAERVSGVALVDGGVIEISSLSDWETAEKQMRPPDIPGVPVERFLGFSRQWPNIRDIWTEEIGEMVLSNFEIRDEKVYRRLDIPRHMQIAKAIYDSHPTELLPQVSCPVLVLVARNSPSSEAERRWDAYRNDGIAFVEASVPQAELIVMEDTIHDVPVQRPRELADALTSFLTLRVPSG